MATGTQVLTTPDSAAAVLVSAAPAGGGAQAGTEAGTEAAAAGPAYPWDERVPPPGRDATLLAVVPIPGTQTSLAIVGYAISTSGTSDDPPAPVEPGHQPGAGLVLDQAQRRVWADGSEVTLTFQEFELLAFLSAHPVTVFSRADLLERAWQRVPARGGTARGGTAPGSRSLARDSRTIDVHVSRLRHKLGPVYSQCLVTEHRAGYQFRPLAP